MDYLKFYDLKTEPFQNDLDPRFFFESQSHKRARMQLLRGFHQRKNLFVALGGPGCGKTTLAHQVMGELAGPEWIARMVGVTHAGCADGWFIPHIASLLGVTRLAPRLPQVVGQIHAQLVKIRRAGKRCALFVDEAQLLGNDATLDEFRGLLNLTDEGERLISIALFGHAELGEVIRGDEALSQRIDIRMDLGPLDHEQSLAYLRHRLECAGSEVVPFTDDALEALFTYSGGVPRVLNTLADNALFEGAMSELAAVDGSVIASVADSLGYGPVQPLESPPPAALAVQPVEADPASSGAADWVTPMAPVPGEGFGEVPDGEPFEAEASDIEDIEDIEGVETGESGEARIAPEPDSVPFVDESDIDPKGELSEDESPFNVTSVFGEEDSGGPDADLAALASSAEVEVEDEEDDTGAELKLEELLDEPDDDEISLEADAACVELPTAEMETSADGESSDFDLGELLSDAEDGEDKGLDANAATADVDSDEDSGFNLGEMLEDELDVAEAPPETAEIVAEASDADSGFDLGSVLEDVEDTEDDEATFDALFDEIQEN